MNQANQLGAIGPNGFNLDLLVKYFCHLSNTGGNAGLAAAYSAKKLGVLATIIVPDCTTPLTVKRLQDNGAEVELFGKVNGERVGNAELRNRFK